MILKRYLLMKNKKQKNLKMNFKHQLKNLKILKWKEKLYLKK